VEPGIDQLRVGRVVFQMQDLEWRAHGLVARGMRRTRIPSTTLTLLE
jgi:hypothetical protein